MAASRRLDFAGASGARLAAALEEPAGPPRGHALFAHCFTCTKDVYAARHVARSLAAAGVAVLRFDFTGLGESEGDFASSNFSSNIADLRAAAEYMAAELGGPQLMVGHSLGGAATLAAAATLPQVRAVCTIGAPADPAHVEHLFTERSAEIKAKGEAEVLLAGRPFTIQRQFIEDLAASPILATVATMGKPLLICHAPEDATVELDNARRLYEAARHPKSFLCLDGADHLLTRKKDAEYAGAVIAAWAGPHLGE
ncbi:MAG: alpha/beta fold hydrolase [Betaproteobacteria bacterium AqS2]|uniref:Alpha/beta fold hydrolase n=1 Tax=Candidatus Amphirhobacter heronislandensis TaxID=1732024 RepID=A0A930UHV8_9GAMM|nr:alpha/beta fold hydrolase [Betaproteobacteria bacterium AqS2]